MKVRDYLARGRESQGRCGRESQGRCEREGENDQSTPYICLKMS
jgi:hypothetical protein